VLLLGSAVKPLDLHNKTPEVRQRSHRAIGVFTALAIHAVRDLAARRAFDDCKSSTYRTQLRPGCKGSQGFKHCSVRGSSKGEGQTGHTMVTYLRLAIAGLSLGCPAPIGDAARCSSNILGREVKEGRY